MTFKLSTKKCTWSLKMASFFYFSSIKNWFVFPPANGLKEGKACEGSTLLEGTLNNHFKLKLSSFFQESFFPGKLLYYKILLKATTRKFCKILSNVTSWRSAMILKKTSIKGIFLRFSWTVSQKQLLWTTASNLWWQ